MTNKPAFNIGNILSTIAAIAADNLMHNQITKFADGYHLYVTDGMGNVLTEHRVFNGRRPAVEHAGIWYRNYQFGKFQDHYPGSMGDGKGVAYRFSRMGAWDAQDNQRKGRV